MTSRIQLVPMRDFTGGLNLRADQFQLAPNESPDLLNVDVDPRGGFRQRKGVAQLATLTAPMVSMAAFETTGGIKQVVAHHGTSVGSSTGGAFTGQFAQTAGTVSRYATFKDNCYIVNGVDGSVRWTGSVATRLPSTVVFNDDLTNPVGGQMPRARCVTVHQGSVWVANTVESNGTFKNRVRWSHPNFPEDWRSFDFIDVDTGTDGDEITALVPFGDRLLVFKRRSVHAIYGFGPDGFSVLPVHQTAGAVSQEAVVNTDMGVFFFHWPLGVFSYDGKNVTNIFERIFPAVTDGTIPPTYALGITLGWGNRRLWVSVPWQGSTVNARSFVLDPTIGKTGAWVQYDLGLGPFLEWKPTGGTDEFLAGQAGQARLLKLDQERTVADDFGSGAVHITSYYRTRWADLNQPAVNKRWKRPEFVLLGGSDTRLTVSVYADYDSSNPSKSFVVTTVGSSGNTLTFGGDSAHGWDSGNWARTGADRNDIVKGQPLGNGRSISLRLEGPITNVSWGVDSATLKMIPRPVRS